MKFIIQMLNSLSKGIKRMPKDHLGTYPLALYISLLLTFIWPSGNMVTIQLPQREQNASTIAMPCLSHFPYATPSSPTIYNQSPPSHHPFSIEPNPAQQRKETGTRSSYFISHTHPHRWPWSLQVCPSFERSATSRLNDWEIS